METTSLYEACQGSWYSYKPKAKKWPESAWFNI